MQQEKHDASDKGMIPNPAFVFPMLALEASLYNYH